MPSSLGLYIGNHIIKYAKVTKDSNTVKVDSFGIKFYDNLTQSINQIINETFSYKIPISINLVNENYEYFHLFSMLNKKDIKGVIDTEFESICYERNINKDAFETRYMLVNEIGDREKIKAIHISANKIDINRKMQQFEGNKLTTIVPLPISITNLLEFKEKENVAIVNIEDNTTITTIIEGKIYNIDTIPLGMDEILSRISSKENSYSKAYDRCRNSTIYTSEGKDLQFEENIYLEDIMPTLYEIVGKTRSIIVESLNKIDKVYITGTGSIINNIDIYFQEYLQDTKCEILKPYFIQNINSKINIKDYIEVNSAIALALQCFNDGIKNVNFKKATLSDKLPEWTKLETGKNASSKSPNPLGALLSKFNINIDFDLRGEFSKFERLLLRLTGAIISAFIIYIIFAVFISSQLNEKQIQVEERISLSTKEIQKVKEDVNTLNIIESDYNKVIEKIRSINEGIAANKQIVITPLLHQIMSIVPKTLQITSIENTVDSKIIITAQTEDLQQLGFFKAKIISEGILNKVESNSGTKKDNLFLVTIVGELP